jgi:uncharacterized Zn-binding protein involved in type VI secretion
MSAAKHTDPIVGMDMHMIQPPPPAPPLMVPHPVAGMVMDPADYSAGACTVFINGLPRARAGTMCVLSPPHVPIGGVFVKPPLSEAELYQGSSTVTADGEALSAMGHQVLGCHDIGTPAPVRSWKQGGAKSLMKAGSVVLPIAGGSLVNVGGSPTTSASGGAESSSAATALELTLLDPFGVPLEGIHVRIVSGDVTVSLVTNASGKIEADDLTRERLLVQFGDLVEDAKVAIAKTARAPAQSIPANTRRLPPTAGSTFCSAGEELLVIDVPCLQITSRTTTASDTPRVGKYTLMMDEGQGDEYEVAYTIDDPAHTTRIDDNHIAIRFMGFPPDRTYSLRFDPPSNPSYFVFRRAVLPFTSSIRPRTEHR